MNRDHCRVYDMGVLPATRAKSSLVPHIFFTESPHLTAIVVYQGGCGGYANGPRVFGTSLIAEGTRLVGRQSLGNRQDHRNVCVRDDRR